MRYLVALLIVMQLLGASTATAEEPLVLLRADGSIEFRRAGGETEGVWRLYVHGPRWEQVQAAESRDLVDQTGQGWRTLGGKLPLPAAKDRFLLHLQKYTLIERGLSIDVDWRFRREARLNGCNLALFWETAALGGQPVWLTAADGRVHALTMPPTLERLILWTGEVREVKLGGSLPLTLSADRPLPLIVQDNREYSIPSFEFRFNPIAGGGVAAGDTFAAQFRLTMAEPAQVVLDEAAATATTATAGWVPWTSHWNAAPLDLSWLNHRPAGRHGFLTVQGDRFAFADGTPARFWGINLSADANFPEPDHAAPIAARLAAHGINLVRIHHADAPWAKRSFIDYSQPGSRAIHAENFDRYHRFAAALREQGIYVYLDLLVHRRFRAEDGVVNADQLPPAAKPYALFDPRLIELQQEYARVLWTTANPHTGLAPKDDPQYVLVEYANEHDYFSQPVTVEPYRSDLETRFRQWAEVTGESLPPGPIDFTQPSAARTRFFAALQQQYHRQMRRFLRDELGVRIPMTGSNWARTTSLLLTLQDEDFLEAHAYSDHPWGDDHRVRNARTTQERRNLFAHYAFNRLAGKPFVAMEWDQSRPNEWRAELPLLAAAGAAFQGFDGIGLYTYRHAAAPTAALEGPFDGGLDPARVGLFYHAALLYRRDVAPAQRTVTVWYDRADALAAEPLAEWQHPPALEALPERHRVEVRFADTWPPPEPPADPTWATPASLPWDQNALPGPAGAVRSDTGQLWRSWQIGYGTLDTPGTQAVYGTRGMVSTVRLADVTFELEQPFATLAVSSLTAAPIASADRLLVTTVARVENSGQVYNLFRTALKQNGRAPLLLEPVTATLRLVSQVQGLRCHALGPLGERLHEVPTTYADGTYTWRLGEPAVTLYYLIERAP